MNRPPFELRSQIISLLVERMSMRAISRVADVSINTVKKLLEDVGHACTLSQNRDLNNLQCQPIECDAFWSFSYR